MVQHLVVIHFACAASIAALDVIVDEDLPGRSLELGDYFKEQLKAN